MLGWPCSGSFTTRPSRCSEAPMFLLVVIVLLILVLGGGGYAYRGEYIDRGGLGGLLVLVLVIILVLYLVGGHSW